MASLNGLDPSLLLKNAQQQALSAGTTKAKDRYTSEEADGIRHQAKRFEAIFVKMVIDSMRKNVEQSDLFGSPEDPARNIYQGMLDSEYAQTLSGSQNFGLADAMMKQFGVEPKDDDEPMPSALSMMLGGPEVSSSRPSRFRGTFQAPVRGAISSRFGMRVDPLDGDWRQHDGVDIALPSGSPVKAAASGVVVFAGERGGYGRVVEIDHQNGYHTIYGHLDSIEVAAGATVRQGAEVGTSGNTGRSTGPHLHFEVRVNGQPSDPTQFVQVSR